ncbi:MAG TPA: glycosyltransferase family 4 protein [Acidimicrobiales bacterium]|nr:glycosyltransferase family 4 protein [Acidimicrobiales bacterium]
MSAPGAPSSLPAIDAAGRGWAGLRVAMVCPYSLSIPGGVQGQVMGIAKAMRELGVEVRALAPCDGPPPEPWVSPLGASVPTAANGSVAPIAPDPSAALRTIRALRDEQFDIVHLHEPLVPGPTLTALVFSDRPLVGTFHRAGDIAWYRALKVPGRWAARRLSVRCAVSGLALATARRALGGQYELLWNGIDIGLVNAASAWPTNGPTVLFLGRHEPRKGLAVLVEAVMQQGVDARVWVAGDGPQSRALREATMGDARFEWLGTIDEEEKLRRLRGADVLVAPSLHGESFGVVLLEGMAARATVVASDIAGYANVARGSRDAFLVPPGDPAALAGALQKALAGGPEVKAMQESAYQRAAAHSLGALAQKYLELYEPLQAERQRRR